MGLIGGIARTAVVAGTFTAVSNRVSRRQGRRWAQKDQSAYPPQRYAPRPAVRAPAVRAPAIRAAPTRSAAALGGNDIDLLTKMAQLHEQGVLTDEEFAAKKAKILGI